MGLFYKQLSLGQWFITCASSSNWASGKNPIDHLPVENLLQRCEGWPQVLGKMHVSTTGSFHCALSSFKAASCWKLKYDYFLFNCLHTVEIESHHEHRPYYTSPNSSTGNLTDTEQLRMNTAQEILKKGSTASPLPISLKVCPIAFSGAALRSPVIKTRASDSRSLQRSLE